jgi:hypothetical protein
MRQLLAELAYRLGNGRPLKQAEMADWLGVTQSGYSSWVTGRNKPSGAVRSLIDLALKAPHLLDMSNPGTDGMQRLIAAVGIRRACAMVDKTTTGRVVDRLAWLVERCVSMAPGLLDQPAEQAAMPAAPEIVKETKFDRAARASSWPDSWLSPDGIVVRIPEDLRGYEESEIMPYLAPKAVRIKTAGKWHNFDEPQKK